METTTHKPGPSSGTEVGRDIVAQLRATVGVSLTGLTFILVERMPTPWLTKFVADRYFHASNLTFTDEAALLAELEAADRSFAPSTTVGVLVTSQWEIVCTARLIGRTADRPLPFEREFLVDLEPAARYYQTVYEFARLASDGHRHFGMVNCVSHLLWEAVGITEEDLVVAGVDSRVERVFAHRGWRLSPLGRPQPYLGSETVPVRVEILPDPTATRPVSRVVEIRANSASAL